MTKRRTASKAAPPDPARSGQPAPQSARPPLPSTSRSYGKVTGGKSGKPVMPKAFSHRKRG
jgi:hypothetical protein